jgi:antitoxin component YwqK of YwqJK toxin-antitoxin module
MKKLIIHVCFLLISTSTYSGLFIEINHCFEIDSQKNIAFLPNDSIPYTGIYLCKFDNGKNKIEGSYKNGKFDGNWTTWYDNGQKESEVNYKNGKFDGLSIWWNKRGQQIRQKEYRNGKLDGKFIEWFQFNGEIKREENYKNGLLIF